MKRMWNVTGLAAIALAAGGCQWFQKKQPPTAQVPPPAQVSGQPQPFEPVRVEGGPGSYGDPYAPASGPNAAPPPMTPGPTAPGPGPAAYGGNTYTIRKGDTLWSIAQRHYGNGQRWIDIANANPGVDPQKLAVGQTLVLP